MSHKQSDRSLKKARDAAKKLGVTAMDRHIFLCADLKTAGCASKQQMTQSWKYLKQRLKELKLEKRGGVLRSKSACLTLCKGGPLLVIYPDGVWYGSCTPKVIEQILQKHVIGGEIVDEYVIAHACSGMLRQQWDDAEIFST